MSECDCAQRHYGDGQHRKGCALLDKPLQAHDFIAARRKLVSLALASGSETAKLLGVAIEACSIAAGEKTVSGR